MVKCTDEELLIANTMAGDIAIQHFSGLRLKIPCPPEHFAVVTYYQAKMVALVVFNADIQIPEGDVVPLLPNKIGMDLWFLLYDFYEIDDFHRVGIRAELSRPISYNDKNVVNSFSTRLILDIHGPEPIIQSNDAPLFTPDIDLDIIKAG